VAQGGGHKFLQQLSFGVMSPGFRQDDIAYVAALFARNDGSDCRNVIPARDTRALRRLDFPII
jgi:hypothetical protein